jgi:hypothetical protein
VHTWFLPPLSSKPDFRLVISFLWDDLHNVDTEGDADNPASLSWTWLHVRNRQAPFEAVEIDEAEDGSRRVRVRSVERWMAAAVAFFLAKESGCSVSRDGVEWITADALRADASEFDLEAGLARAASSVWRRATRSRPYPNRDPA